MTLYEINGKIAELLEGAVDQETGEIQEEALAALEDLEIARETKIENVGLFIKNLEADAKAIKEEAKNLTARAKAAENKAEGLRNYLAYCLGGEKFQTPKLAVTFRHSKKVVVDENRLFEIPEEYLRNKEPEVDKKRVSEALKSGEAIPGCTLVDSVTMQIK